MSKCIFVLASIVLISGCSTKHWDWYDEYYVVGDVTNSSNQDVQLKFCDDDSRVEPLTMTVPNDRQTHTSEKKYLNGKQTQRDLRPPGGQDGMIYKTHYTYAILSANDESKAKVCIKEISPEVVTNANYGKIIRNSRHYLVLDKNDVCPNDYQNYAAPQPLPAHCSSN